MKLRLPAYGKQILALREKSLAPRGWLNVVRKWPPKDTAPDSIGWFVVVPGSEDPSRYDLSLCAGLPVFVVVSTPDHSNAVLVSMVEQAKPAIGCVLVDGEFSTWIGGIDSAE